MFNFDFYNPTHILFGKDKLNDIGGLVPPNARVLITYGGGSARKSGLLDRAKAILGQRTVLEFGGIEPNPRYETLMKAVDIVRRENIDFLLVYVAVGAGFALFVFALSVVSIPLMLDRNQDAITSMLASLRALMLNPLPLLVWAALIVTLTLIGFLSFHIGLVVMMPVVGHATWHAYRELVEPLP